MRREFATLASRSPDDCLPDSMKDDSGSVRSERHSSELTETVL